MTTRISFCQHPLSKCADCSDKPRCDYTPKVTPEPTTRTCPECGYVNGRDAMNCANCDHPLVI